MSKQKDYSNPDMKEIFFEENRTKRSAAKAGGSEKKSRAKKAAMNVRQAPKPSQKKRGFLGLAKKDTAVTQTPVDSDPLNDLELIDLMDDDALERLAEKDWEKDMKIASIPGAVAKGSKEPAKTAAKGCTPSIKETKSEPVKAVSPATGTGRVSHDNNTKAKTSARRGYRAFSHIKVSMVAITLLICVLTGIVANRMLLIKQRTDVLASFVGIGSGMSEVHVIGQQGLIAVSEGRKQALEEEQRKQQREQQEKEQAEKEALAEKDRVQVELVCQTIMGDLKIKFVNEETKRVIAGVPFCAEVKGPDGKVVQYVNEDRDGIIYLSPVPAGEYTITMGDVPTGDKYKKYVKATKSGYVAVNDTPTYEVVDVTDEVVTEAEAADEQKVVNDIVEENVLQDTVAFVESTKTLISGGESYLPVDKSEIEIPASPQTKGFISGDFVFMAADPSATEATDEGAQGGSQASKSSDATTDTSAGTGASNQESSGGTQTPTKTYTAEITNCPTEMKVGDTVEVKIKTNLNNPSFEYVVTDGSNNVADAANPIVTGGEALVKLTAKQAGNVSFQFHVRGKDDNEKDHEAIPTAVSTITVLPGDQPAEGAINESQKITTKDKKDVYVQDASGNYITATYGDYQANKKLYVRSDEKAVYKYTGWQSIDGATYYYTADGQPVKGEQVIRGVKYTFGSDGVLQTGNTNMGIDVSAHQGAIDWAAVKTAGVSFAIIRVGFRGYGTGRLVEDSYYRQNLQGAINNGIRVGVYIFSAATNEAEAVEEASLAINLIRGYNISYPVYIDMESSGTGSGRADNLSVATRTAIVHAFCRTVANAGYKPGVYSNTTWYNNYLNTPELTKYSIWLAQYNTHVTYTRTKYDIWQYSSKGSIPGINTRVDMNIGYTSY